MSKIGIAGEVLVELQDGDVERYAFSSEGEGLESVIDSAIGELGRIQRMIEKEQAQADMRIEDEEEDEEEEVKSS